MNLFCYYYILCDAAIAVDETFQTETVDNNVVVVHYNSLVLGGNNYPHIDYSEKTDTLLEHDFFSFCIQQILLILVLLIPLPPVQNGLIQQNR
ncbi:MAG: hypothetical protein A4E25_00455 [Methanobacterium sp. PtaB.Bin024]|jgi:hypothetical protein|nr:MAG: hypothetical protein A4E25_00455 [Methanobacterium sp. PtaB.Bin024]